MSGAPLLLLMTGDPVPAYDLNFMGGMPAGLTYTNSSTTRTYFGSDGLLKTAVANESIFEYNPVTLALLGMRWEMEQRTNLLTYSDDFNNAAWGKNELTVSSDAATAPTGTVVADKLIPSTNNAAHWTRNLQNVTSGVTYTTTVFAKADGNSILQLASSSGFTSTRYQNFNLATGALGGTSGGITASIDSVGNGWYRCRYTDAAITTVSGAIIIAIVPDATSARLATFAGNGTSGVFVYGAQMEAAASASSYIPTAGSAVTRQPDVLTASSISPWYNQSEGTVVFEGIASYLAASTNGIFVFSDGTTGERVNAYISNVGALISSIIDGGVIQASITTANSASSNSVFRSATAYKANDFAEALNGGTVATDTSGTTPTVNQLRFGAVTSTGVFPFMGYARRFQYYRNAFPGPQLQGVARV